MTATNYLVKPLLITSISDDIVQLNGQPLKTLCKGCQRYGYCQTSLSNTPSYPLLLPKTAFSAFPITVMPDQMWLIGLHSSSLIKVSFIGSMLPVIIVLLSLYLANVLFFANHMADTIPLLLVTAGLAACSYIWFSRKHQLTPIVLGPADDTFHSLTHSQRARVNEFNT